MRSSLGLGVRTSLAALALLALAGSPAGAQAQVSGSVQDPQGDGAGGGYMRDIRSLTMSYDGSSGTLDATVRFWDLTGDGYPWFTLLADVGVYRNGGCDSTSSGGVLLRFAAPTDEPGPDPSYGTVATIAGAGAVRGAYESVGDGWRYWARAQVLATRSYDCVARIRLEHGGDVAGDFCMGARGAIPCSEPPQPPANVRASVVGGTVSLKWDRSGNPGFAYFAVRRGTQPDTNAGAWTRLPGNFSSPAATDSPPGPGTYHYYVTEIDKHGRVGPRSMVASADVTGAPTGLRATVSGRTVTLAWDGSEDARFSYFAVRRSTQPDPNRGTWTRLAPSFTTPTATDTVPDAGTYYYFVTQVTRSGAISPHSNVARADVAPRNAVKTGSSDEAARPGRDPEPGTSSGSSNAAVVTTPGSPPVVVAPAPRGRRAIGNAQAVLQARAALRRLYRKAFVNGSRVRLQCRRDSRTKQTCQVSWRYRRFETRGTVVVRLKRSTYASTVAVERRRW